MGKTEDLLDFQDEAYKKSLGKEKQPKTSSDAPEYDLDSVEGITYPPKNNFGASKKEENNLV